jgi:predicted NUDIX family NTP pyrophosphohydrolase
MSKQSAGILLYRKKNADTEVLLVHPGGPFWAKKDVGAWSIPKGEFAEPEEVLAAAKREFAEELGSPPPDGEFLELGQAKQSSGKVVHAWALEADFDAVNIKSNTFHMEWPPKSGQQQEFPEVDRAAWFPLKTAGAKLVKGQLPLLEALASHLGQQISTPEQTTLL